MADVETPSDAVGMLDIEEEILGFPVESAVFEGEGDFCRAFKVNEQWIVSLAWNDEGSRTLEREAMLLPQLAPAVTLPVPNIQYLGRQRTSGRAFIAYRRIGGVELTPAWFDTLSAHDQERHASDLARFLCELHSFDLDRTRDLGVVECDYPFCRTDEGINGETAAIQYRRDLTGATLNSYFSIPELRRR